MNNSSSNFLRETRTKAQESYLAGVIYSKYRVDLNRYPGPVVTAIVRERNGDRARRGRTACGYHCRVKRPCVHQLDLSTDQPCSLWYKRYTTRPACVNGHTQPKRFTRNLKKRTVLISLQACNGPFWLWQFLAGRYETFGPASRL